MAINVLPLLQNYQGGLPASRQYNSRGPADTSTPDEAFTARHQAAYEEQAPFTDARGYVWRNRAAYDASLAALQRQQAQARDPAYQTARFAQNNFNMGNRGSPLGFQTQGIPGTVVADPSGVMTADRRAAMEEAQRAARGPGFSAGPRANLTTLPQPAPATATATTPQPFTSLLSSFGSGRRGDLPYWMRR